MKEYNTKQRERLLSLFRDNPDRSFSHSDVALMLPEVGQATIYRLIPRLLREGYLMKVHGTGHETLFQYRDPGKCRSHLHIRCMRCGCVSHLDESVSEAISSAISEGNGFELLNSSILEGICPECRKARQ